MWSASYARREVPPNMPLSGVLPSGWPSPRVRFAPAARRASPPPHPPPLCLRPQVSAGTLDRPSVIRHGPYSCRSRVAGALARR